MRNTRKPTPRSRPLMNTFRAIQARTSNSNMETSKIPLREDVSPLITKRFYIMRWKILQKKKKKRELKKGKSALTQLGNCDFTKSVDRLKEFTLHVTCMNKIYPRHLFFTLVFLSSLNYDSC